jgi:hypothetical protein
MEIVPDSFLDFASPKSTRIQVRYFGKEGQRVNDGENSRETQLTPDEQGRNHKRASLVVIRQPYSFLASAVRSMFEGDDDVQVIIDRRKEDRRRRSVPVVIDRRAETRDRRGSFPILDVVMDLDA